MKMLRAWNNVKFLVPAFLILILFGEALFRGNERIEISKDDLENNAQLGFVNGITKILMDNLNQLTLYQRPIHCTDTKRETLYIKDNNKWDKDHNKEKLEQSFKNIQAIQIQNIQNWQNENEGWQDSVEKKDEYIQLVTNVMTTLNKDKMIKETSKEVLIKK